MRNVLWLLGSSVFLFLAACSTTSSNLEPLTNQPVPFKAHASGSLSPTGPDTFELAGTGNDLIASHLGHVDYAASVVITSGTVGVTDVTDTLTETLTAANGDTLTISCQQTATLSEGVYYGTDTWTVIGGTGRFSGATGSGSGNTTVDLATSTFTKELTGTITF